jgi:hypothetical protein
VKRRIVFGLLICGLLATAVPLAAGRLLAHHAAAPALFVSTTGSDSGRCTQASPCASLNRAYLVAKSGQVVEIAAGSYPYQQINSDGSKTSSADVIFQPAAGANVVFERIALGDGEGTPAASHVTIKNVHAGELEAFTPARDITWIGIDAGNFYIRGVQGLTIKGGDWGPCGSRDPSCGGNNKIDDPVGEQPNDRITIDGAKFHDFRIQNPEDHFECLFLRGGTNIAVRNSTFTHCDFYDIFLQHTEANTFDGLRIERNWFDMTGDGRGNDVRETAVAFSPRGRPFNNMTVRNNSFRGRAGVAWNDDEGDGSVYSGFAASGNVFGTRAECYGSVAYAANIWEGGGACSPKDAKPPYGYAAADGRLVASGSRAQLVRRAFALAAKGRPVAAIARAVHLGAAGVRAILANPVYLGNVYGANGAHPALVARKVWTAARKKR